MKNLEAIKNLNPFNLPFVQLENRQGLPKISGIYFVLEQDAILYIGRTNNLKTRWISHHRIYELDNRQSKAIKIAWLKLNNIQLLPEMESILIQKFNPLLNFAPVKTNNKNDRFYVSGIGDYFMDALVIESALRGLSRTAMAGELIAEALDDNEPVRNTMIEYLAKKKKIDFSEMIENLLAS